MRGDAELASVMRKLLKAADHLSTHTIGRYHSLTLDDTTVELTEEEAQIITEEAQQ